MLPSLRIQFAFGSLFVVTAAALILFRRPRSPFQLELRRVGVWIIVGNLATVAFAAIGSKEHGAWIKRPDDILDFLILGTIVGTIGGFAYWLAGFLSGSSFSRVSPSAKKSKGVVDRDFDEFP